MIPAGPQDFLTGTGLCGDTAAHPPLAGQSGRCGYGPRLPPLVVSPWARHNAVDHTAKYEVYRQNGATSEQLGETPGTSFTVGNLNPGSRYTVNVLTRDTAGNVSWASPPLTFTTGTPATSTCAVRFTDVNDWGNGYVGGIEITNTGTNPVSGWTLTFAWPTGWQSLGGGWNGNWTQTGSTVTVTNTTGNGTLAAGGDTTSGGSSVPTADPTSCRSRSASTARSAVPPEAAVRDRDPPPPTVLSGRTGT